MTRWNPNYPNTAGLEWRPYAAGSTPIGGTPGVGVSLDATANEAVDSIDAYLTLAPSTSNADTVVQVDIYDASDLVNDPPWVTAGNGWKYNSTLPTDDGTSTYGGDVYEDRLTPSSASFFVNDDDTTTARWERVNENLASATSNWFDYINPAGYPTRYGIGWKVTGNYTSSIDNTPLVLDRSVRIAALEIRTKVTNLSNRYSAKVWGTLGRTRKRGILDIAPWIQDVGYQTVRPSSGNIDDLTFHFPVDPFTGVPWNLTSIDDYKVGVASFAFFGLQFAKGPTAAELRVYSAKLQIITATEHRLATGHVTLRGNSGDGWKNFPLVDTATGLPISWNKLAGRKYWVVFTTVSKGGTGVALRYLDGAQLTGIGGMQVPTRTAGVLDFKSKAWPPTVTTAAAAVTHQLSGGGIGPDSQPYADIVAQPIAYGKSAHQDIIDLTIGASYGVVGVHMRAPSQAAPSAPLVAYILDKTAADAIVAGPYLISTEELAVDNGIPQLIRFQFDAFVPLAGHQYRFLFISYTTETNPWYIYGLDTLDDPTSTSPNAYAGFGGQNFAASIDNVVKPFLDFNVALSIFPVAPATLTAAIYTHTLNDSDDCLVPSMETIRVDWGTSPLPLGEFIAYELQRDDGDDWQPVAYILDRDAPFFYDFESRRNTLANYRVRTVRNDGAMSLWTSGASATPVSDPYTLILTTNIFPSSSVAYEVEPTHPFEFLDAADVVEHQFFGRDFQVAFLPTEHRGDRFTRTVIIGAAGSVPTVGREAFVPLVGIDETSGIANDARFPYVAVLDGDGNRWFANVKVGSGERIEPGGRYEATLTVVQTTTTPVAALASFVPTSAVVAVYGREGDTYGDGDYGT